jgi:organic radical activating enzyme
MKLPISEIFYSIQGEGNSVGVPSLFIRLSGCNLSCSWCDTKFAWGEGEDVSFDEILTWFAEYEIRNVVFTGGEPLIFEKEIYEFILYMNHRGIDVRIEIETNGTILPKHLKGFFINYNVSPKLSNSNVTLEQRYKPDVLNWFNSISGMFGNSIFKFVYDDNSDGEILKMVNKHEIDETKVYIMPKGDTTLKLDKTQEDAVKFALRHSFNFSPRLQVMLWGKRRGV